ncbi:MAG: O-antigen ligase family protein [Desulfobacteraceae bacterium]
MERTAYILYLIVLLLSILMFGAVHTYMYTFMSVGVLLASLLVVLKSVKKDHKTGVYGLRLPKVSLHVAFVILAGFLVLQMVLLPGPILGLLSPEAWVVGEKSLSATEVIGGVTDKQWFSLASYTYPVRMALVRFVVYGLFFFGLLTTLSSQRRINLAVAFLLIMGCFEALYGLMETYSGSYHVLWYKMNYAKERVKGTYINGNHFAGFMAMGVLLSMAFVGALTHKKNVVHGSSKKKSLKSRITALIEGERDISQRMLVSFAGVVMGLGLIFSASRGAIISWAVAMFLMGVLLVLRKGYRRKGIIILAVFVLISAYALKIGVEYPVERFMKIESGIESRSRYADKTLDLFGDFKVTGVGLGNFQYAFPKYQAEKDKKKFYRFAHNDWAQFLAEAGVVGVGLLLTGVGYYMYWVVRLWRRRTDPYAVSLGFVPLAVIAYMMAHSLSEFNLHTPANFLVLVAIMAVGYAALHLERHHRRERMAYGYYEWPLKYKGGVALALILGLMGWTGYASIRHFMGEVYCNTVPNSTLNRDRHPPVEEVAKAIGWDGGNAEYWYKLGSADYADYTDGKNGKNEWLDEWMNDCLKLKAQSSKPEEGISGNPRNVRIRIGALEKSVALNPFEATYHLRLGWAYAHQWKEKDYYQKWLPAADISMDRAAYFAGVKNPHLHQELGNYWAMRSRTVYPNHPLHHEAWSKACWHYRKARGLESGHTLKRMKKEIRDYVWNIYPDESYVAQVMAVSP